MDMVPFFTPTKRHIVLCLLCFFVAISVERAFSQISDASALGTSGPVAYVYVTTGVGGSLQTVEGFASSARGALTALPSTPQANFWGGMASDGRFLFGSNGIAISSFVVEPGGTLRKVASLSARQYNGAACGGPSQLFVDRTGTTLYDVDSYGSQCANNTYQAFTIEPTGALKFAGATIAAGPIFNTPLSFVGNNSTGYGSSCYHFSAGVYGFDRASDGSLTLTTSPIPLPSPQAGNFYCTYLAAADSSNHVAVSVQQLIDGNWLPTGLPQIAIYTATTSGSLVTKSTYTNMPQTSVNTVNDLKASPSGKLLAVAGSTGLQLFRFNGSAPATRYTGLLTTDGIDQMFWDKSNHLYAISRTTGKLYVFTASPTHAPE